MKAHGLSFSRSNEIVLKRRALIDHPTSEQTGIGVSWMLLIAFFSASIFFAHAVEAYHVRQ